MKKCHIGKITFKQLWNYLVLKRVENENDDIDDSDENSFFNEIPFSQEILTESINIYRGKLQYSNFVQQSSDKINKFNLYECFHGLLNFIYYYSGNNFNIEELEFHFSGGQLHNLLSLKNNPDQCNILNIFDYENINNQFTIASIKNAFFGLTFKNIKVNPIAYSIRSGILTNSIPHLISFTFEGFDDNTKKWVVLDERVNINDLIPTGSFSLFFVRSTDQCFSSFIIKQTDPGSNGFWGFSISAFDIHGVVSLRENISSNNNDLNEDFQSFSFGNSSDSSINYDSSMNMADFLF